MQTLICASNPRWREQASRLRTRDARKRNQRTARHEQSDRSV